eukprot:scaffold1085_cov407-Prasinococcus_capsulatus_cf.AAC.19
MACSTKDRPATSFKFLRGMPFEPPRAGINAQHSTRTSPAGTSRSTPLSIAPCSLESKPRPPFPCAAAATVAATERFSHAPGGRLTSLCMCQSLRGPVFYGPRFGRYQPCVCAGGSTPSATP